MHRATDKSGKAENKAYLTKMGANRIVQFVLFETLLNSQEFALHWEHYNNALKTDATATLLQQSEKSGLYRYISQHYSAGGEFRFGFKKARRSPHQPGVEIRIRQLGGYKISNLEKEHNTRQGEIRIFVFFSNAPADLKSFGKLIENTRLNHYEAYYENCAYSHILEFFVKSKDVAFLLEKLKQNTAEPYRYDSPEIGVYNEFDLPEIQAAHS